MKGNIMNEREQELIDLLTQASIVLSVKDIAHKLFISEPTARRYLSVLEQKGLILRTHGGAMINHALAANKTDPFFLRSNSKTEKKNEIAKKAATLIRDGSVIFLDASSTAFHLLPYLKNFHNITVCTNGLKTATGLAEMGIHTILFGGAVNLANVACDNAHTIDSIKKFNADILFFSCDALSDDGLLTDNSLNTSCVRAQYVKNADTCVLLLDSSKLHKKCWYTFSSMEEIDYVFSDEPIPQELESKLRKKTFPLSTNDKQNK